MPKADEQTLLLREIRDILREQHALEKAKQQMEEQDQRSKNLMSILHMLFTAVVCVFTVGAFWYFYHTVYGTGLLGN